VVGEAQKSHGAKSELNSVFGLGKVYWWNPIRTSAIQSRFCPVQFLGFFNHEKGALRQEIFKVIACFQEVGGALKEVQCLPREVLQKRDRHCTSTKL
jgi:hypothetical protein